MFLILKTFTYHRDQAWVPWLPRTLQHSEGTCSLATPQTCADYTINKVDWVVLTQNSPVLDLSGMYNKFGAAFLIC